MPKKVCFKCGVEKDLEDFYKHPQMYDGHLNKCKECAKKDARERNVLRAEYVREYDKLRNNRPERKKHSVEHEKKWRKDNPEKYRAHCLLYNAIRDHRILRPNKCEICGKTCIPHGHHYDYSKPLDVIWMCAKCHGQIQ